MSLLGDTLALFLALVLTAAATQKAVQPDRLAAAAGRLLRTGSSSSKAVVAIAGGVELLAGISLLLTSTRSIGAGLAMLLWLAYAGALRVAARRREAFDCGCTFVRHVRVPGAFEPLRAAILALLALAAGAIAVFAPTAPFQEEALLAALALLALKLACDELGALPSPLRRHHA